MITKLKASKSFVGRNLEKFKGTMHRLAYKRKLKASFLVALGF